MLLIIDLETDKNSEGEEYPSEVGIIAYDQRHKTVVSCFSTLIYSTETSDTTVHRIPNQAVLQWGIWEPRKTIPISEILSLTNVFSRHDFDYVVAHSAEFERQFIDSEGIPWLCTYKDFALFPEDYTGSRNLTSLAQWYGVGISMTHRVFYDCLLLAEVFNRVDDLRGEIQYAALPKVEWLAPKLDADGNKTSPVPPNFIWDYTLQGWFGKQTNSIRGSMFAELGDRTEVIAEVSYENRQLAKQWGFTWDGDEKTWRRLANPDRLDIFPFEVRFAQPLQGVA